MLGTFLKSIYRSALRDRLVSVINISGMAIGLAAGFLILVFVTQEYTRDAFHENAQRIFRVEYTSVTENGTTRWADTPARLLDEVVASVPSAEHVARYLPNFTVLRMGDSVEYQSVNLVDAAFLEMFSFEMVEGNPTTALDAPESAVVTQSFARRYFGSASAMGEVISLKSGGIFQDFTVTGVLQDPPETSSIQFEVLLPFENAVPNILPSELVENWGGQMATFVTLREGVDVEAFETAMNEIVSTYGESLLRGRTQFIFSTTPLEEIYFDTEAATRGVTMTGQPDRAETLFGISLLIILIACVNFTTLSIARSTKQNRSIGIRKVVGATRGKVMTEYLLESLVKTAVAAVLGLALAELLSDSFSRIIGSPVDLNSIISIESAVVFAGIILVVAMVAGAWPAFKLSSIRPIHVLQGHARVMGKSRLIRSLVVVQFAITAVLLISAMTMSRQVAHMQNLDRGLDLDRILVVRPDFTSSETAPNLYRRLKSIDTPEIAQVARTMGILGSSFGSMEIDVNGEPRRVTTISVSDEFTRMLGVELIAGEALSSDAEGILVNKAFADMMGQNPDAFVGSTLLQSVPVRGVSENYYYASVSRNIGPFALTPLNPEWGGGYVVVEYTEGNRDEAVQTVASHWREIAPDVPFDIYDLKAAMTDPSGTSAQWNLVLRWSTIFSVFIACMGLFGLGTLTAMQRTKEIGIRKVLGASRVRLTGLLVRETALLALIASLVAAPVGWYLMHRYLEDFANRVPINPLHLAALSTVLILVAIATVSFQSIRVSLSNPVDSLRRE